MVPILILVGTMQLIEPIFNKLCSDQAKSEATLICNHVTKKILKNYQYSDFIQIHRDKENKIQMIQSDIVNMNTLIAQITQEIQEEINNTQNEKIYIRLGSFTGISLLAGRGPKIPICISTIGNIETDVKSEFIAQGVNQTRHKIYLEIQCEISILTPINIMNETIHNQVLIAENIIVGEIPSTYYNLEGLSREDVMQLIQ